MTIRSYQFQVQALVTPGAGGEVAASVAQALNLTDAVEVLQNTELIETSDELGLSDLVGLVFLPGGVSTVDDDLGLSDEVRVFGRETIVDALGLGDLATFDFGVLRLEADDALSLGQTTDVGYLIRNITVVDSLGLSQTVGLTRDFAVTAELGLSDRASFTDPEDILGFTDVAEWGRGFAAANSLGLTQDVDVRQLLSQSLSSGPFLSQAVAYYFTRSCSRREFGSFHGEGGVAPKDKPLNYSRKLSMQSLDTGQFLELKNPETDDRRRLAFNRVNREFYDGTADVYTDNTWITEETQIYTLTGVKRETLDNLFQFLLGNLGRDIILRDWKGVTWIAMVVNPGEVYTEDSEGYWTLDFEVQGSAIEGEYALDANGFTEVTSRAGSIWNRLGGDNAQVSDTTAPNFDRVLFVDNPLSLSDSTSFTVN